MTLFTGILVYVVVWWLVFFTVLPWGIRVPEKQERGHAESAPEKPMLWRKALITSLIAAVIWGATYAVIEADLVSFRPG